MQLVMTESITANTAQTAFRKLRGLTPAWVVTWFAVLLLVTVVVRIADPTGWLGADDSAYYSAAELLKYCSLR